MRFLFERLKTVAEPSGACALAALLAGRVRGARAARRRDDLGRERRRRAFRRAARRVASRHGLERPDPRRRVRRPVRRAQARALLPPAAAQVTRRQRRQLHALHAAAAGRGGRHARAAPRGRAAARAARAHRTCELGARDGRRPASRKRLGRARRRATRRRSTYDQLIVTLGSTSRTLPIPGLAEHAMGFKTLSEAIALRNRLVQTLETAESIDDDEARDSLLTYVFVGAGYAGVEGLAELQDFAADVLELLPALQAARRALHARRGARPADARALAAARGVRRQRAARGAGSRSGSGRRSSACRPTRPSSRRRGRSRRARVAWTAGVSRTRSSRSSACRSNDAGRIKVDRVLPGRRPRRRVGDRRRRRGARPGATRAGEPADRASTRSARAARSAHNVAAALGDGASQEGVHATRRWAGSSTWAATRRWRRRSGIKWRGFPAWFLARTYHLSQMPGNRRRVRLRGRLDRRAAVRPRHVGARAARPPAAARGDDRAWRSRAPAAPPPNADLTGAALALVLASAALHALWNTLLADTEDTHASTAVALLAAAVVFAPVAALTWDVDGAAVPYVLASAALRAPVLRAARHGLLRAPGSRSSTRWRAARRR